MQNNIHDKKLYLEGVTKTNLQEIPDTSASNGVNQRKEDATRMKELVRKWANFLNEHNAAKESESSPTPSGGDTSAVRRDLHL